MYDRLHTAGGSQTHTRVALVSEEAAWPGRRSGTSVTLAGFAGPSGPFPTSWASSGGLHHTTRSAGST